MYKPYFDGVEWTIIDADGIIISDPGEFVNKNACVEAARKINADAYSWSSAAACDAPHLDNLGASPD